MKKQIITGLIFILLSSFAFDPCANGEEGAGETQASGIAEVSKFVPEQCIYREAKDGQPSIGEKMLFEKKGNESAAMTIMRNAEDLMTFIITEKKLSDSEINTNYKGKWKGTFQVYKAEKFANSFRELDANDCVRKDLYDLDDIMKEIRHETVRRILTIDQYFQGKMEVVESVYVALEREREKLSICAKYPAENAEGDKNQYYSKEYKESNCGPEEEKLFQATIDAFKALKDKINKLSTSSGWDEVSDDQGWKEVDYNFSDEEARKAAEDWYKNNFFPELATYASWEKALADMRKDIASLRKEQVDRNSQIEREENFTIALNLPGRVVSVVMREVDQIKKDLKEKERNQKQWMDTVIFITYSHASGDMWKAKVQEMESSVINQKEHLLKIEKALKKFVSKQAQNIP